MPHQVHQRTFGRKSGHRRAMLRNLTLSVLRYEKVRTTEAKAKEVRGFVDKMINLGKDGSLPARRRALAWLPEPEIVEKVFTDLAARYPGRGSGYLRLSHLSRRVGDSAPLMLLELVPGVEEEKAKEKQAEAAAKPRRRLRLPRRRASAGAPEGAATDAPAPTRRRAAKAAGEGKA